MKRIISILVIVLLSVALAACTAGTSPDNGKAAEPTDPSADASGSISAEGSDPDTSAPDGSEKNPESPPDAPEKASAETVPEAERKDVLVVFFSATGTTKGVAEKIAAVEDADLYEIKAAQEYTDADLNWHDSGSRTTLEQNDKNARPEIGSESISLEGYTTVYVGYPIWWGEEPRIMDTFAESYDFDGITVVPFCTSGGSGIGRSGKNLAENAGSGTWLDGQRFSGSVSEAELKSWIDGLK